MSGDFFPAQVRRGHQAVLSNFVGRLQQGMPVVPTASELTDLGNLAGGLNYWAAQTPASQIEMQAEIPYGDYARRLYVPEHRIFVFPFRADSRARHIYGSASENPAVGGQPVLRVLTVSRTPGDLSPSAITWTRGAEAGFHLTPGVEAAEDELLYVNTMIDADYPPGTSGSGFSIVWQAKQP